MPVGIGATTSENLQTAIQKCDNIITEQQGTIGTLYVLTGPSEQKDCEATPRAEPDRISLLLIKLTQITELHSEISSRVNKINNLI